MNFRTNQLDRAATSTDKRYYHRAFSFILALLIVVGSFGVVDEVGAVSLSLSSGSITIDTDLLTISGSASASGTLESGVAVFQFDSISLTGGGATTVTLTGSNPLSLRAFGDITIGTSLNGFGFDGSPHPVSPGLAAGGLSRLGGGAGGDGGQSFATGGFGTGAGGPQTGCCAGGGGGAFGGDGGSATSGVGLGGTAYGSIDMPTLIGGSGGGGGPHQLALASCCSGGGGGGAGGGALEIVSEFGSITFNADAIVNLNGGDGLGDRSGGGGSGGGLKIDANEIIIDGAAMLSTDGGSSTSTASRAGGGGGGGRMALLAASLDLDGVLFSTDTTLPISSILSSLGGSFTGSFGAVGLPGSIEYFATEVREQPVPEPSSFLLLGLGAMGLVRHTRRQRRQA